MTTLETRSIRTKAQNPGRRDLHVPVGTTMAPARSTLAAVAPQRGSTSGQDVRDEVVGAMLAFHRSMMSRLGGASAAEWLRVDLSSGQVKLLFWLAAAGEQPMSHVARAMGIGMPAATSVVDKLVDHGLVAREHSPLDRRVVLVHATDAGQALAARLRQISEDQWRNILSHVPDESLPALQAGIAVLTQALVDATGDAVTLCPVPSPLSPGAVDRVSSGSARL